MPLRLAMMGTGQFALPTFLRLCESSHDVVGLFTQPDRTGRGHHRHRNAMKEAAAERGIPVDQPASVNDAAALAQLRSREVDLCVVAAYGQILSSDLLAIPVRGAINVHASVLPKFRGAAPVQYAVLRGETETGVTVFQIEPKLDAGPILGVAKTPIGSVETAGELETRLADLAAPLTCRIVDAIAAGEATPLRQDNTAATRAPRLKKSDGAIDWSRTSAQIACHVRAMQPWPSPFCFLPNADGGVLRLKVQTVRIADSDPQRQADVQPGTILSADDRLIVSTADGAVEIESLQPEGRRTMTATEFLRGHRVRPGDRLISAENAESSTID